MENLANYWFVYLAGFGYVASVLYFCVVCMAVGGSWWIPLALPVFVPGAWLHRNRVFGGVFVVFCFVVWLLLRVLG